jgi:Eco57I restriction-modification methylase
VNLVGRGLTQGGFDVMLGNPPWDVSEFKSSEWPADQRANGKANVAKANGFYSESGQFPLCRGGKLNLYAAFIEATFQSIRADGYCGLVAPLSFVTDQTTSRIGCSGFCAAY